MHRLVLGSRALIRGMNPDRARPAPARRALAGLALGAALVVGAGCGADVVPTTQTAPAPLPEIVSAPPVPGMVWAAGCWHWDGAEYVWLPGHWESPPPSAAGAQAEAGSAPTE